MILVIGANGWLGYEICRQLTGKDFKVRALIRDTNNLTKRNRLTSLGVQVVPGDLREPESFLGAFKDIKVVITTASSIPFSYIPGENDIMSVDLKGVKSLIDYAKKADVKRFIYVSFSKNITGEFPLRIAKRSVEGYLRRSGIVYTILRPSFFMETWLSPMSGFNIENGNVVVYGNGQNKISFISIKDVAKFAVESISNMFARNTIFDLGGPHKLSQLSVIKIFEELTKNSIEKQFIAREVLKNNMKEAKNALEKSLTGLKICLADGDIVDMKDILDKFQINLTSVREFAKKNMLVH